MSTGSIIGDRVLRILVLATLPALGFSPAAAEDLYFTNGYLTVRAFTADPAFLGLFTVSTGEYHPTPDRNVFFPGINGYFTLLDYTSEPEEIWLPWTDDRVPAEDALFGRTVRFMISLPENPSILQTLGPTGYLNTYTLENFIVTQTVMVSGTTMDDTFVQHTLTVKNTTQATREIGLRNVWDFMIGEDDDALFRTRLPDSDYTADFATFPNPCFAWYEMTDDAVAPTFTVFGTAVGGNLEIPPVPPDEIMYASMDNANYYPWSFINAGGSSDSSIAYFWGKYAPVPVGPGESVSFTQYVTTAPQMIEYRQTLDMEIQAPESAWTGEEFDVVLRVINSGNTEIDDIHIVDTLPGVLELLSASGSPQVDENVLSWRIDSLAAWTQVEIVITVRIPIGTPVGEIANIASASYWRQQYCDELFPTIERSAVLNILSNDPCSLKVTKQAPASAEAGDSFEYRLSVKNEGEGAAYDIIVTDTIPAPLSIVSWSVQPEIYGQLLVWRTDVLVPGDLFAANYTVRAPRELIDAELTNSVQAHGHNARGNHCSGGSGEATVHVYWEPHPAKLEMEKQAPETARPNDIFDYSILVRNTGTGSAWNIEITDTLPAELEMVSVSGLPSIFGRLLVWRMAFLAAGAQCQFNVRVKVPAIYEDYEVVNRCRVVASTESETGNAIVVEETDATVLVQWEPRPAIVEFEKSAPAVVAPLQEFEYLITVRNEGSGSAWNVVIVDTLPAQLELVSVSGSPQIFGSLLVWRLDSLSAGSVKQFALGVKALQQHSDFDVENASMLKGLTEGETGTVQFAESALAATQVDWEAKPAELGFRKAAPDAVAAGDEFEYLLTVQNTGIGPAWDLVISDTLPGNLVLLSASGSPEVYGGLLVWRLPVLAAGQTYRVGARVRGPRSYSDLQMTNFGFLRAWTETPTGTASISESDAVTVLLNRDSFEVRVFPNPFDRDSAIGGTLKFEGVVPGTWVRIYTVRGLKVWEGVVKTPYRIEWDGTAGGKRVAPGTYIWAVEQGERIQRGTMIVK